MQNKKIDLTFYYNEYFIDSEHRKMRAKQQHVCMQMNQYMINTNQKWGDVCCPFKIISYL
jgi:hypothetical protein